MPVVRFDEILEFEVDGLRVSGLATPSRGAAEIMLWRTLMDPGSVLPAVAQDHERVVAVLRGAGVLTEGSRQSVFASGDVLILPAGILCQIAVGRDSASFECVIALPVTTRHFTSAGDEMRLPWAI